MSRSTVACTKCGALTADQCECFCVNLQKVPPWKPSNIDIGETAKMQMRIDELEQQVERHETTIGCLQRRLDEKVSDIDDAMTDLDAAREMMLNLEERVKVREEAARDLWGFYSANASYRRCERMHSSYPWLEESDE